MGEILWRFKSSRPHHDMTDALVYVGQKAFIENRGKILAIQDSATDLWDFPGGKIKWDESLEESLKREVREETDLEIKIGKPFHIWKYKVVEKNSISFGKRIILIGIKCEYVSGTVRLSDEHSNYEWVTNKDFGKAKYSREWLDALNKYFTGS